MVNPVERYVNRLRAELDLHPVRFKSVHRLIRPSAHGSHWQHHRWSPALSHAVEQPTGLWTNAFGYDSAGRLTNVTSKAGAFSYTLGGTSSESPLIKKLLLPNTSYITNGYDSNARLIFTKLNNSSGTTLDSALYGYNVGNERTAFTNAAGTYARYSYDNIGELTVARTTNSSGTIIAGETKGYAYDAG